MRAGDGLAREAYRALGVRKASNMPAGISQIIDNVKLTQLPAMSNILSCDQWWHGRKLDVSTNAGASGERRNRHYSALGASISLVCRRTGEVHMRRKKREISSINQPGWHLWHEKCWVAVVALLLTVSAVASSPAT